MPGLSFVVQAVRPPADRGARAKPALLQPTPGLIQAKPISVGSEVEKVILRSGIERELKLLQQDVSNGRSLNLPRHLDGFCHARNVEYQLIRLAADRLDEVRLYDVVQFEHDILETGDGSRAWSKSETILLRSVNF